MNPLGGGHGRVVGFKTPFVTLYHRISRCISERSPGLSDERVTQSILSRADLKPPYRILRPFSRFEGGSSLIAFDLDGREVWVARDQVELVKGSLGSRSRAAVITLTLRSARRVKIWYGPPPEEEVVNKGISLKVKPLRLAVATLAAVAIYVIAGKVDPLGALSAADNYSDIIYQQVYRAASYEKLRDERRAQSQRPLPKVVVFELLEEDLALYEETWPASYDFHAWFLERLRLMKPAAVLVDIAFIDDRSDSDEESPPVTGTDPYRFFRGGSAYLGDVVASYREDDNPIPLFFAATPCLLPFFLPKEYEKNASRMAVAVPGGRYLRQGSRYPLWDYRAAGQRCARDSNLSTVPAIEDDLQQEVDPEATPQTGEAAGDPVKQQPAAKDDGSITSQQRKKSDSAISLPSAACAVFDAVGGPSAPVCTDEKINSGLADELKLHWSTPSFELTLNGDSILRNGRYPCLEIPSDWWQRLWLLFGKIVKDQTFEFVSPLRQTCPPVQSYRLAQMLEGGFQSGDLENAVVIYAQNLTGLEDGFTPPTHWPLNGVYFHAMAIENLLIYGGPKNLIGEPSFLGVPMKLLLMLLGFLLVVPLWEYSFILLSRIERAGSDARTAGPAFRFYGIWIALSVALPVISGLVVLGMIFVATMIFNSAPLNFIGLFALVFLRSLPRAWKLLPPLWPGLGGWQQGSNTRSE